MGKVVEIRKPETAQGSFPFPDLTKPAAKWMASQNAFLGTLIKSGVVNPHGLGFKFSKLDRKETAKAMAAQGASTRDIAAVTGWDQATIVRDLNDANASSSDANASLTTRELLGQSDQNDWRTPRKFLDAAREVMGAIDLDPATSVEANETVQAATIYTETDNGLQQPWKGTVWLNPPYGGEARLFVERLVREYQVGNVTAACALLNSHPTETKWFQQLFDYTICFIAGRIDFGGPSREVSSTSTHGSAIAFLGVDIKKFAEIFGKFGAVIGRIK